LSDAQIKKRVDFCRENLAMFNENKWRLYDIFTGDVAWIYHRKIQKKQMNASWVAAGEKPRTVVKRGRFEQQTMVCIFFKSNTAQY